MEIIGYMHCSFKEKFGIPRQSGLVEDSVGFIEILSPYNQAEAFRGLSEFSHIWLLWSFHKSTSTKFNATVKPPKLGGNKQLGVFATRSPFRPNNIGLSSVRLLEIKQDSQKGTVSGLVVSGSDLLDMTPIYDIKPYLPYTDCHTEASGGWTDHIHVEPLKVVIPEDIKRLLPEHSIGSLTDILSQDPRPGYQDEPDRVYGMLYDSYDIHFTISGGILSVIDASPVSDIS
jgi:tRNA-Thr(GGU) m(6)t(6)A37 methyltransferase TsaA